MFQESADDQYVGDPQFCGKPIYVAVERARLRPVKPMSQPVAVPPEFARCGRLGGPLRMVCVIKTIFEGHQVVRPCVAYIERNYIALLASRPQR